MPTASSACGNGSAASTGPTVIVAHGAIGRCLIGLVSDLSPEDMVSAKTPQGCFCRLENGQIDWFDAYAEDDEAEIVPRP